MGETDWLQRIATILRDMVDPGTDYKTLAKREGFGEVVATLYKHRHPAFITAADAAQVIKYGSENKLSLLTAGLFNRLFYSGRGNDWWINHFKVIASEEWEDSSSGTAGGIWMYNRCNISIYKIVNY